MFLEALLHLVADGGLFFGVERFGRSLGFYGSELFHQGKIVLQVPVVGDLPVLDAIYVNRAEANPATIAFQIFELAGEMAREDVSDDSTVLHNQQLLNFRSQIGNGSTKVLRCLDGRP